MDRNSSLRKGKKKHAQTGNVNERNNNNQETISLDKKHF